MVILARARYLDFPVSAEDEDAEDSLKFRSLRLTSPIVLVSFILPVLHISLDQFGFLNAEMRVVPVSMGVAALASQFRNRSWKPSRAKSGYV